MPVLTRPCHRKDKLHHIHQLLIHILSLWTWKKQTINITWLLFFNKFSVISILISCLVRLQLTWLMWPRVFFLYFHSAGACLLPNLILNSWSHPIPKGHHSEHFPTWPNEIIKLATINWRFLKKPLHIMGDLRISTTQKPSRGWGK